MSSKKHPLSTPIAIVGASGVFPGTSIGTSNGASNKISTLKQFWYNIENKVNSIIDVPHNRWIVEPDKILAKGYKSDMICSKKAGLIENFNFNCDGFTIDKTVLKLLDPLYHLILHAGRDALQNCMATNIIKQRTGVVLAAIALPTDSSSLVTRQIMEDVFEKKLVNNLGISNTQIINNAGHNPLSEIQCAAARVTAFPAAVFARAFGFGGGSFTIDAACASSLFAIKIACDKLNLNHCDMMITGGVSRPDSLYTQTGFTQLQALSPTGRCAPFDKSADGLVVGEGAGIIVLKRVDDAVRCGDNILGLICSTGVSNDITGNLIAPDSSGQIRAMEMAYKNAGWLPSDIDYMECHGAGTPLGDTVELSSMKTLWDNYLDNKTYKPYKKCSIGSVKSMIGHLLTGAGAASIIKLILAINNKTLPPTLNFTKPPDKSPIFNSPFKVQTTSEQWLRKDKNTPRRAAISAFGFGGINAHMLIEEWRGDKNRNFSLFISKNQVATENNNNTNQKNKIDSQGKANPSGNLNLKGNDFKKTDSKKQDIDRPDSKKQDSKKQDLDRPCSKKQDFNKPNDKLSPIAIVGMETICGGVKSLKEFEEVIFSGNTLISKRPEDRWKGFESAADKQLKEKNIQGNYINNFKIGIGEFHIPPNELPDILPQHLLMLKTAAGALKDANFLNENRRSNLLNMGCAIGISFDFKETDFHARWNMENSFKKWEQKYNLATNNGNNSENKNKNKNENKNENENESQSGSGKIKIQNRSELISSLKDLSAPPLTPTRTVGALGSIIASRIAREFKLCGTCFVVSGEETSGIKALEVGVTSLQLHETDSFLVGAVDLPGELRSIILSDKIRNFSTNNKISPFDISSTGTLPGEGAVAIILKRLDQAISDNDKIYAVIKGTGCASSQKDCSDILNKPSEKNYFAIKENYKTSLNRCFENSNTDYSTISYIETHGSSDPFEDSIETDAIAECFSNHTNSNNHHGELPIYIGSVKANIGHTGAASGLFSLVKTCICLSQKTIVPLVNFSTPANKKWNNPQFNIPITTKQWPKENTKQTRQAVVSAMTADGNCTHVILEEFKSLKNIIIKEQSSLKNKPVFNVITGGNDIVFPKFYLKTNPLWKNDSPKKHVQEKYFEQENSQKEIFQNENSQKEVSHKNINHHHGKTSNTIKNNNLHNHNTTFFENFTGNMEAVADVHKKYLGLSNEISQSFSNSFGIQAELIQQVIENKEEILFKDSPFEKNQSNKKENTLNIKKPAFSREMCMEFATGSVGKVLGPDFDIIDTYNVRVRLPDEPLMLVDRIISIEGEKQSLQTGKIVTEHDVHKDAWYLDGQRMPVSLTIEAGQADLFLCSYLGIDHIVKGKRSYRLLDALVTFHRELPKPNDVIRYEIIIDKFIRQGKTWLFFFQYKGYIGKALLISMRNGCAGFFTKEEVKNSGGIILTKEDTQKSNNTKNSDFNYSDFCTFTAGKYNEKSVNALRSGNLEKAFGSVFKGKKLAKSMWLPGGRLNLIDRVLSIDPYKGQYGMGTITAQADINPDDWFLTCHFIDDMVMPGTLMYECCAHTLRIFTLRMGWAVINKKGVCYEPIISLESDLKCRGPVTPETKTVTYQVEIKEIGYNPEPYVIADAYMYSDDLMIVYFKNMGMKITGITKYDIDAFWQISSD